MQQPVAGPLRRAAQDVAALRARGYVVRGPEGQEDWEDVTSFSVLWRGPEGTPYAGGVFTVNIQLTMSGVPSTSYPLRSPSVRFVTPIFHPNIQCPGGSVCVDVLNDRQPISSSARRTLQQQQQQQLSRQQQQQQQLRARGGGSGGATSASRAAGTLASVAVLPKDDCWRPSMRLHDVFEMILPELMKAPEPDSPLNLRAARLWESAAEAQAQIANEAAAAITVYEPSAATLAAAGVYDAEVRRMVAKYAAPPPAEPATSPAPALVLAPAPAPAGAGAGAGAAGVSSVAPASAPFGVSRAGVAAAVASLSTMPWRGGAVSPSDDCVDESFQIPPDEHSAASSSSSSEEEEEEEVEAEDEVSQSIVQSASAVPVSIPIPTLTESEGSSASTTATDSVPHVSGEVARLSGTRRRREEDA